MAPTHKRDKALLELGRWLRTAGYRFVAPTPATHARVNARPENLIAHSLADVFGWNRPFRRSEVPQLVFALLEEAEAVEIDGNFCRSAVRFASLADLLLVHSAYPTDAPDSVFLGPDTYRFARLLRGASAPIGRALDVGCGSGAGGLYLHRLGAAEVILTDVNEKALRYSRINAALNEAPDALIVACDALCGMSGPFDLVISNAPYLCDGPAYRDGGTLGIEVARRIVEQALTRLAPGGRLLLYTGAPIVAGADRFYEVVGPLLAGRSVAYEEIDPDLFGEELEKPSYAQVDRIAAVALSVTNGVHHA
jgi:methylase of polypeptide subunit release factors